MRHFRPIHLLGAVVLAWKAGAARRRRARIARARAHALGMVHDPLASMSDGWWQE